MEHLPTVWFILIAVLWTGYLILEGFDLGVGMLMKVWARNESQRRVLLNTIGPVWEGNEVWLITAAGAMFAAFPLWYAAIFSALYLPLTLTLLALIVRAVAIHYRSKSETVLTRRIWDACLFGGSAVTAFFMGALLGLTTTGLPLNENGDRVGGAFAWLTPYAVLGGLAVLGISLAMGWAWLGLKTLGAPREAAGWHLSRYGIVYLLPMAVWAFVVVLEAGRWWTWAALVTALTAGIAAWIFALRQREGWSFVAMASFVVASMTAIFGSLYPVVLPSTLDPAFHLTIDSASSSGYTLSVMAWVAAVFIPLVLAYTAYSYWVFRQRLSEQHIPEHAVVTPV
ncbi:MAG: cytochrome d ubiquinol oxidase subunit II [Micrococcaceae bacterium]